MVFSGLSGRVCKHTESNYLYAHAANHRHTGPGQYPVCGLVQRGGSGETRSGKDCILCVGWFNGVAVVKQGQVRTVFYVWVGSMGWQW